MTTKPTITAERLAEIESDALYYGFPVERGMITSVQFKNDDEIKELLRLARLGLWAQEHAVPALRLANYEGDYYDQKPHKAMEVVYACREALAALPAAKNLKES